MSNKDHKQSTTKSFFKENEYFSFMLSVFILGGLAALPIFWGYFTALNQVEGPMFPAIWIPTMMLSTSVLVAFKKDGTSSKLRTVLAIIIGWVVSTILASLSGKMSFISNTFLGFIILLMCGKTGTWLASYLKFIKFV